MNSLPKYITQEQQEQFERFLLNQMTDNEACEFNKKLDANPEFEAQFLEFKALFEAVEENALHQMINEIHSELDGTKPGIKMTRSRRFLYLAASLAIVISLGTFILYNLSNSGKRLYKKYFIEDPGLPTVMGESSNYNFYEAMVYYKHGDYEKAINIWEQLHKQKPGNDTLNYYLGMALLVNNDEIQAIQHLNKVNEVERSVFKKENYYALGMAYLKINEKDKAIKYLELSGMEQADKVLKALVQ